jgi:hypothetical protein
MAEGDKGMSKSSGRTNAGEGDARHRRGEGVGGESESDISSILVHSFPATGCEVAGGSKFFGSRNPRGDKTTDAALLGGRLTGRFGENTRRITPDAPA